MSPDRDSRRLGDDDPDMDEQDDEASRSIFSALWFRALLVVLVLGVIAAVAIPYVLDSTTVPWLRSPSKPEAVTPPPPATATPPAPTAPPTTAAPAETTSAAAPTETPTAAPTPSVSARATAETPAEPTAKPAAGKPAAAKSTPGVAKAVETSKKAAEASKKAAEAGKPAPKVSEAAATPSPPKAAGTAESKAYWVQVGAFKDAETARRIAARLREQGLRVEESTTTAGAPRAAAAAAPTADRYDVLVSGAPAAEVEAKLAPKGLKGEVTANGVVVRPSLALRDAVALSRDLADAGLSVQVRRIGGPAPAPAPAPAAAPAGGQTLHRVRVGGYADRTAAVDAMKQLEGKGFKPFIARGNE